MRTSVTATQINVFDDRFYFVPFSAEVKQDQIPEHLEYLISDGGIYLPSSTHILDVAYSKGEMFNSWLKDVGHNAKVIAGIAAERGSRGHHACERLLNGDEIDFEEAVEGDNYYLTPRYSLDDWKNILKFKEFMDQAKPTDVRSEEIVFNLEMGYAGTRDIRCVIDGETWIIDLKFGNSVYDSHYLQLESYARCEVGIDRIGVLHMKAQTRGERKGKIQGKGWQVVEPKVDREELFNTWKALLQIYKFKNNGETPRSITIPKKIKL